LFLDLGVPQSIYYNSDEPSYGLPGTAEHIQQQLHVAEGDALTDIVITGAPVRVILPGYSPVLMGVGRLKLDLSTGELTFTSQFDQLDGNLDAVCAALAAGSNRTDASPNAESGCSQSLCTSVITIARVLPQAYLLSVYAEEN
jgi:hypothetical protein